MGSRPLLFYDSGAGGLPYLKSVRDRLPTEHCVYLADRANFPLGEKSTRKIRRQVLETVRKAIRRFDPCLIVVACNTASVVALRALRKRFPIPFVGVVPAVKPAALTAGTGRVAVVATRRTASGPYLKRLVSRFATEREVIKIPVAELVNFAEFEYPMAGRESRLEVVRKSLEPLLMYEVQAVVLGCTHFVLLEREFAAVLKPGIDLIDSREGVTNRVISLRNGGSAGSDASFGNGRPFVSARPEAELFLHGGGEDEERYRRFARIFDLRYRGQMEETRR